jgi:hypothetical protein
VFVVFSRVSSKTVLLFPTDVFRKNESEKDGSYDTKIPIYTTFGLLIWSLNE